MLLSFGPLKYVKQFVALGTKQLETCGLEDAANIVLPHKLTDKQTHI